MTTLKESIKINIYTDGSAKPNPGQSGYGFYGESDTNIVYNGYGFISDNGTNNAAELTAALKALSMIKSEYGCDLDKVYDVTVFSDSEYLVKNINNLKPWEKKNWADVKNHSVWQQINTLLNSFVNINVNFKWVEGHTGVKGNENADKNADKGRMNKSRPDFLCIYTIDNKDINSIDNVVEVNKTKTKDTSKTTITIPQPDKLNPLLSGKRWFFYTNSDRVIGLDKNIYLTSTYVDDDDKAPNKGIAKRSTDTHYSIFITDEPLSTLDCIRDKFDASINGNAPIVVDLMMLKKPIVWKSILENGNTFIEIENNNALTIPDKFVIGDVVYPPRQVYVFEDIYNYGLSLIERYQNNDNNLNITNINNFIFEPCKNGIKLSQNLISGDKHILLNDIEVGNLKIPVKLVYGIDLPPRNNLTALTKIIKEDITISLLTFDITERSYRIGVVIKYGNKISLFYNNDSNYRLFPIDSPKRKSKL